MTHKWLTAKQVREWEGHPAGLGTDRAVELLIADWRKMRGLIVRVIPAEDVDEVWDEINEMLDATK